MKIKLAKNELIHLIGIGGIGMSSLAFIMMKQGFNIQGSDIKSNQNIERLKKNQIKCFLDQKKQNIQNATIIIISSAIKKNNPELVEAKKKNIPIFKRGKMLGHVLSLMKNIVVTGSHGKTTTTSLISTIFGKSSIDPTIINGGVINSLKTSAKLGRSSWSVVEADESDGSFLDIIPTYSIITNIDREHMDFYKSMKNLKKYFKNFIDKTPPFGKTFICMDDKINYEILKNFNNLNCHTYGLNKKSNYLIKNVVEYRNKTKFDLLINNLQKKNFLIKNITTPLLGIHNVKNCTAAFAVSYEMGISTSIIKSALKNFQGVHRRFIKVFSYKNIHFYDDYAHHPTEIKALLDGIKNVYNDYEKICVFEPHRISRLNDLKKDFSKCFKVADTVILCPIYSAGEKNMKKFNIKKFAYEISKNSKVNLFLVDNKMQLFKYLKNIMYGKKIIVGMGAGNISNWMWEIPSQIR